MNKEQGQISLEDNNHFPIRKLIKLNKSNNNNSNKKSKGNNNWLKVKQFINHKTVFSNPNHINNNNLNNNNKLRMIYMLMSCSTYNNKIKNYKSKMVCYKIEYFSQKHFLSNHKTKNTLWNYKINSKT